MLNFQKFGIIEKNFLPRLTLFSEMKNRFIWKICFFIGNLKLNQKRYFSKIISTFIEVLMRKIFNEIDWPETFTWNCQNSIRIEEFYTLRQILYLLMKNLQSYISSCASNKGQWNKILHRFKILFCILILPNEREIFYLKILLHTKTIWSHPWNLMDVETGLHTDKSTLPVSRRPFYERKPSFWVSFS